MHLLRVDDRNPALISALVEKKVPFLDLRVTDPEERAEIHEAIDRVLQHGRILLGPEVEELEAQFAAHVGRRYAVGVGSGTDALIIAQRALGIAPGDEVITTPLSFIATANSTTLVGGKPIFADLGDDLNVDPASIELLISGRTKAIIPVHWTGLPCDMDHIMEIANKHGLAVIEDCSQAYDAAFNGRKVGSFGALGCFSMNSMKVFASLGEAGMIVTDDKDLYEKCVMFRYHGLVNREYCVSLSQNGRIDTLQAAVLLVRMKRVGDVIRARREIAARYDRQLAGLVKIPVVPANKEHVYYTYTIQSDRRDDLKRHLEINGVEVKVQHPLLMPQHPVYERLAKGRFPRAQQLIKNVLCIPANEKTAPDQCDYVASTIRSFFG